MLCEAYFIATVSLFYHKTQETQLFMFSFIFFVENVRNCIEASNIIMENESETFFTNPKNKLTSHIVSDYKSVYFNFFQQYRDVWNHTFIAQNCFCTFTCEIQTPFHIALYKNCESLMSENLWPSETDSVFCSLWCFYFRGPENNTKDFSQTKCIHLITVFFQARPVVGTGSSSKGILCTKLPLSLQSQVVSGRKYFIKWTVGFAAYCLLWISKTVNGGQLGPCIGKTLQWF